MFHKETNIDSNADSMITLTSGDELLVPAGKMYCVPIIVNSTEITIKWKFSTLYKVSNHYMECCYAMNRLGFGHVKFCNAVVCR